MIRIPRWLPDAAIQTLLLTFLGAIFLAPADGQAPVLGGQCPPAVQERCRNLLPEACPYPGVVVSVAAQQTMAAAVGPWKISRAIGGIPPPGMAESYATVLDWWRAAEGRDAMTVIQAPYCRDPAVCSINFSAWHVASRALKPMPAKLALFACQEKTGGHGFAQEAWRTIYRGRPTLAQWLQIECHHEGGNAYVQDSGVMAAASCPETPPPPSPVPAPPPPAPVPVPPPPGPPPCTSWPISGWLSQCGRLAAKAEKELSGVELCSWCERKSPAPTTTLAKLRTLVCEPVCEVATPPPPEPVPVPPPPSPACPPSAFESHCRALGGSDPLCLALARYVGACDPECDEKCFIPGIPSTGGLGVVLVPGEDGA